MKRTGPFLFFILLLALLPSCRDGRPAADDHGHSHGPGGHSHAAPPEIQDERPAVVLTRWTDRTELFVEYPALMVGATSRAAIHLTDLADFAPLADGEALVLLRAADGRTQEFRGGPSQPGIFGVDLQPDRGGVHLMTLRVESPTLQDVHDLGAVTVHGPGAPLPERGEEGESIAFLKEQQWVLDFGTTPVEEREIRAGIVVPAVVQARSGRDSYLAAPVPGRIDPGAAVPVPGSKVRVGTVLARIAPSSDDLRDAAGLRAALVEAEQERRLAFQEHERVTRLIQARAIPARRLQEAEAALAASDARLEAARERWGRFESLSESGDLSGPTTFAVRAPFDGVVTEVRFSSGNIVAANEPLLRLVDPDLLHVVGLVPESRASELNGVAAGELVRADTLPIVLGAPLSVGSVVDPVTRTTEVRFALDNRRHALQVGESATLRLFVGDAETGPAIPESAVVDDAGQPVVFVQLGGESFERRPVRLGARERGYVRVLRGVENGERVVHRGAYLVRLASASTQVPAHGHVH